MLNYINNEGYPFQHFLFLFLSFFSILVCFILLLRLVFPLNLSFFSCGGKRKYTATTTTATNHPIALVSRFCLPFANCFLFIYFAFFLLLFLNVIAVNSAHTIISNKFLKPITKTEDENPLASYHIPSVRLFHAQNHMKVKQEELIGFLLVLLTKSVEKTMTHLKRTDIEKPFAYLTHTISISRDR